MFVDVCARARACVCVCTGQKQVDWKSGGKRRGRRVLGDVIKSSERWHVSKNPVGKTPASREGR